MPYQGSKWAFRHSLTHHAKELGFSGPPSRVVLTDPGPWGRTLKVVLDPRQRRTLARTLHVLSKHDARTLFDHFQGRHIPDTDTAYAIAHLFLQRLSFSGKAVGVTNGSEPGRLLTNLCFDFFQVQRVSGPTLVYIDPPYAGTTAYPDGTLTRDEVLQLARAWAAVGASVMISESEPLPLPGWKSARIRTGKNMTAPFKNKNEEWLTFRRSWLRPSTSCSRRNPRSRRPSSA